MCGWKDDVSHSSSTRPVNAVVAPEPIVDRGQHNLHTHTHTYIYVCMRGHENSVRWTLRPCSSRLYATRSSLSFEVHVLSPRKAKVGKSRRVPPAISQSFPTRVGRKTHPIGRCRQLRCEEQSQDRHEPLPVIATERPLRNHEQ